MDTGSLEYIPKYDLIKRAVKDIQAGETLGNYHDLRLKANIMPVTAPGAKNPVPAHMIIGNVTFRNIKAGETVYVIKASSGTGETFIFTIFIKKVTI